MIPTSVSRDQAIADQLVRFSADMERTIPDVGDQVSALQVAKLLLTMLGDGYTFTFESTGKVKVDKFFHCQKDNAFSVLVNVLQAHLKGGLLRLENIYTNHPGYSFPKANMEHGDMAILMAVKDFELCAAFTYADNQRDKLCEKITNTDVRISTLETRLMATSDFLGGRRY